MFIVIYFFLEVLEGNNINFMPILESEEREEKHKWIKN